MLSPADGPIAYISRVSAPKITAEERKRRGVRLRAWRKLRGLTQAEAAAAAGVEHGTRVAQSLEAVTCPPDIVAPVALHTA